MGNPINNMDLRGERKFDTGALAAIRFAVKEALDEKLLATEQEIVDCVVSKLDSPCEPKVHPMFDPLAGP